ncbi:MAG: DUF4190 domain-containing protein [Nanoarchaeota archaeon]|nr:DUF4190 domain-containing protein [Nanoarchaeota archaeon]
MQKEKSNGCGVASLILGIAGLLFFWVPILGLSCAIIGLVCSARQKKIMPNGLATAGLVLSIIGLVFSAIFTIIGLFAYLGVLQPQRLLPKSCTIVPGVSCDDFIVTADGSATVILRNSGTKDLSSWSLSMESVSAECSPIYWGGRYWPIGEQLSCSFSSLTPGIHEDGYSEVLKFTYTEKGSLVSHSVFGQLATRYE